MMRRPTNAVPKQAEMIEMVDGRIYWSPDNWQTIYATKRGNIGRTHVVRDKEEADMVRFLAVSQASWAGNAG